MKRFTLCLFVMLASVVLVSVSSAPAYAVDGVVLINQNTIISSLPGCTDPSPGNFPIVICNPGSYRLSGNLAVPAGADGIHIVADKVTLDLNGFSISSEGCAPSGGSEYGISTNFTAHSNIAVRNGSVSGFTSCTSGAVSGAVFLSGSNEMVDHVQASNDDDGIGITDGSVINCAVVSNREDGIIAHSGLLSGNNVVDNGTGIFTTGLSLVTNNNVARNASVGLDIFLGATGYGSNTFIANGTDVKAFGGGIGTSMNNNVCTSGVIC